MSLYTKINNMKIRKKKKKLYCFLLFYILKYKMLNYLQISYESDVGSGVVSEDEVINPSLSS